MKLSVFVRCAIVASAAFAVAACAGGGSAVPGPRGMGGTLSPQARSHPLRAVALAAQGRVSTSSVTAPTPTPSPIPSTCHPVTVNFPGDSSAPPVTVPLTAAVVGPVSNKNVDATGCDIGIYLDGTWHNPRIQNVAVHDANQYGILAVGANNVTIDVAAIYKIGNHDGTTFAPNGVQTGVGIDFEGTSGTIAFAAMTQYQKNGTAFNFGSAVSITDSAAVGLGRVNYIAQNGMQWYKSKVVLAARNISTENHYDNPADPIYNGEATGYLVLCTNLNDNDVRTFERNNAAPSNDIPYYISNNTTNGDCPP